MDGCPFFLFLLCLCVSEKEEEEEDALALTLPFRQLPPFTLFPYFLFHSPSAQDMSIPPPTSHARTRAWRGGGKFHNEETRTKVGGLGFARGAVKN